MKRVTLRKQVESAERAGRVASNGASRAAVRESIDERDSGTPVGSRTRNGATV